MHQRLIDDCKLVAALSLDDHSTSSNMVEEMSATSNNKSNVCDNNVGGGVVVQRDGAADECDENGDAGEEVEDEEGDDAEEETADEPEVNEQPPQPHIDPRPLHLMKLKLIEQNIMLPSELELKYKSVRKQSSAEMDAILIEAISPPPGAPPKSENPARLRRYHRLN